MNLTLLLPIALLAVLAVALAVIGPMLKAKLRAPDAPALPNFYTVRPGVFSPAERSFVGVLDGVLPDGVAWLGKVRLGDVFVTRKGLTASQRASAWNRINQKHVDFLLVRMTDFAPLARIELDDSSHDAEDRKTRDAFVDDVFNSAGLPLLHIKAQAGYQPEVLRASVTDLLSGKVQARRRSMI